MVQAGPMVRSRDRLAKSRSTARRVVVALALIGGPTSIAACDAPSGAIVPAPDYAEFRDTAYPILLRDCGFSQCHGTPERFFSIYGPGRQRLEPDDIAILDPVTDDEIEHSYERARAMLLHDGDITQSPLLSKPLEGGGHAGFDRFGRNVYADTSDVRFIALQKWAGSGANQ